MNLNSITISIKKDEPQDKKIAALVHSIRLLAPGIPIQLAVESSPSIQPKIKVKN